MSSNGDRPQMPRRRANDPRMPDPASQPVIQFPAGSTRRRGRNGRDRRRTPTPDAPPTPTQPRRQRRSRWQNVAAAQSEPQSSPLPSGVNPTQAQAMRSSTTTVPPKRRTRSAGRRPPKPPLLLVYLTRLVVLGVGVAGIAGTTLSVWNPALRANDTDSASESIGQGMISQTVSQGSSQGEAKTALTPGQELGALKTQIQALASQMPGLSLSSYLYDLETHAYFNVNGSSPIPAASIIKIPVLVAFLQDVDAGRIRLDEPLAMKESQIATGSGDMQDEPPGTVYTALETASWMIVNSDNTATNMLIDRLGGAEKLNERFRSWGMKSTQIRNPLPDLEGTNTTSPEDLVNLMAQINKGELLSLRSRDRMMAIMQRTYTKTLIPQGVGDGALVSHKTGDIGAMVGDAGLVDLPNGKRYILVAMVQRPHNDGRAQELIRLTSRAVYDHLNVPLAPAKPAPEATDQGRNSGTSN